MLPDDVSYAICDGMLGADLIGFHTERWAALFRATCEAVVGRDARRGRDLPARRRRAGVAGARRSAATSTTRVARLDDDVGDRLVVGRIDRAELSKNVWRGLLAFRDLLRTRPEWHDRVVHVVFDHPSREDLPEYREYTASHGAAGGRDQRRVQHRGVDAVLLTSPRTTRPRSRPCAAATCCSSTRCATA